MRSVETIRRAGRKDAATGIRRPYTVYSVRVPLPDGKKRVKVFRTKATAQAFAVELGSQRSAGIAIDPRCKFNAAILEEFETSHCGQLRTSARRDYRDMLNRLLPYIDGRPLRALAVKDLEDFRDREPAVIRERQRLITERALARAERRLAKTQRSGADPTLIQPHIAALRERGEQKAKRAGVRTTNKVIGYMRTFLKWAQCRGYVAQNVAVHVKRQKTAPLRDAPVDQLILTLAELSRLLDAADPGLAKTALSVLAYGGLRLGELLGLQWGDVDLDSGRVLIRRQLCGLTLKLREPKTRAGVRFVELPSFVTRDLRAWRLLCPKPASDGEPRLDLVFPNRAGRPMDQGDFRNRAFGPALRRARLRRIRIHDLRYGAASMLIASGTDIASASRQLGHANVAITLGTYSHWFHKRNETGLGARLERLEAERADETVAERGGPEMALLA